MDHADDLGRTAPPGELPDLPVETILERVLPERIRHQIDSACSDTRMLAIRFKVPLAELSAERDSTAAPLPHAPTFRKRGRVWQFVFDGIESFLPAMRGLTYIHYLLAHPGDEIGVHQLILKTQDVVGKPEMSDPAARACGLGTEKDLGSLADPAALQAARTRLQALERQISEAESCGDASRSQSLKSEKSQFVRYLAEVTGLRGKPRRGGSKGERARQACRSAIAAAIHAAEKENPPLAQHLREFVRTGSYCRYQPAESVRWQL